MVLKRVIGLVFAGGLAFSAMAAEVVVRIAPPRVLMRSGVIHQAATMCGFPATIVGMATPTTGARVGGDSLHGRGPTGSPITGFTDTAAM